MITRETDAWLYTAEMFELHKDEFICNCLKNSCEEIAPKLRDKMIARIMREIAPFYLLTIKLAEDEGSRSVFIFSGEQEARDLKIMVCLMYAAGWNE